MGDEARSPDRLEMYPQTPKPLRKIFSVPWRGPGPRHGTLVGLEYCPGRPWTCASSPGQGAWGPGPWPGQLGPWRPCLSALRADKMPPLCPIRVFSTYLPSRGLINYWFWCSLEVLSPIHMQKLRKLYLLCPLLAYLVQIPHPNHLSRLDVLMLPWGTWYNPQN